MKKKKVEVKTDPSYRWRMDKQPEASIYIIYFLFIALFDTPRSSFCLVLGGIFWNFVKKKKKTKKTWRETRKKKKENLPPAIINPIISLYIDVFFLPLCLSSLLSVQLLDKSQLLRLSFFTRIHRFVVWHVSLQDDRDFTAIRHTHTHRERESGGKQQQLSKFVGASKNRICVGEQEWERESEMMDEESGRGYATRILPIYNHRRRCHRDTHIHTPKSMDGQGW